MGEKIKVLITVKTYPLPSKTYDELVCTAGIKENGSFIRLYPIDYRYKPYEQWYKKYEWIKVEVEKNKKDYRLESYRPISDIRPTGEFIGTENGKWTKRKQIVLANGTSTMCALNKTKQKNVSLGIIKPKEVIDFIYEPAERDWKPEQKIRMRQLNMFNNYKRDLEKIPYKFSYKFICEEPDCNGHKMMIEDWELGQLYRKMRDKYKSEKVACEKVKDRFLNIICGQDKDTYFYVGTVFEYGTWIILGTFYPKKSKPQQTSLFK